MGDVMGQVREVSASCLDSLPGLDGFSHGQMGRVGFVSEPIQDQDGQILELRGHFLRYLGAIRDVSGQTPAQFFNNETIGWCIAVRNQNRDDTERAQIKRSFKEMRLGPYVALKDRIFVKSVRKDGQKSLVGVRRTMDGKGLDSPIAKSAKIIETDEVVVVGVGADHGIQPMHSGPQGLKPEIRGGIDQAGKITFLKPDRGTEAFVPGIGG